jgi:glutathione S-transferase
METNELSLPHEQTKRLYQILEDRLTEQSAAKTVAGTPAAQAGLTDNKERSEGPWLVGAKYTIADLACFSWVNWAEWAGVDLLEFPKLKEWTDKINERAAVKKGVNVPEKFTMKEKMKTKEGEEEYEKYHSEWVMKGQEADQEKHK